MKNFTYYCMLLSICLLLPGALYAQEPVWKLAQPRYATADAFVIGINVMDHGADPTGNVDQTKLFQDLLDVLGSRTNGRVNNELGEKIGAQANRNGGVLFVPEGKYLFRGTLYIPKGVTLRGEWEKPVKGQPIKGTVLMPTNGRGNDATLLPNGEPGTAYELQSFIIMQPSSAVMDVNIWYPDQNASNIVPYPPAILFGQQGYWGNDYCLASNITFVNAFDGAIFSRRSGGGAPNCYGIYGTPLRRGIEIDNIAEVGRIDNVDFSADYWSGSGLPGAPAVGGPHKEYISKNGTAVVMRRNDWSFACKVKAEGYKIGYHLGLSYNKDANGNYTSPNGHNYGMEFTDCQYGVYAEAVAGAGMMFYEYKFTNCNYGFYFVENPKGVVQIQACEFDAGTAAIYAPETNTTKLLINQCTFNKGVVDVRGGMGSIVNSDFNSEENHIILGPEARLAVTGNRFKGTPSIQNVSMYECPIDHTPIEMKEIPHFPYKNQYDFNQRPAGNGYFLATAYGVSVDADDNSDALQLLLNQAATEGGGLVFLPPGRYNFRKAITIPQGVELKGSGDVPSVPTGPGSVMEIYFGKDDENGTPFITMERGSGLRGLVMNYPEQKVQLLTEGSRKDVYHYSYTIRGDRDVYIVNVGFRACYNGIDLFTNRCDNHFVDYPAGHVFKTGIRVGGGSKGGYICNAQFNQIAYGSGGETKFGAWPNSPDNEQPDNAKYSREHTAAYAYCWNNLDFIVLEECEDQMMYNNFDFGSNRGFVLASNNGKGPQGLSLGQGIDQGMKAFYIGAVGEKGFDFINSQIVTTAANSDVKEEYKSSNRYLQTDAAFDGTVTFFGADFWGQPQNVSVEVLNGTLEMQAANFDNPGQKTFGSVSSDGLFDLIGTNINNISSLLSENSAPQFFVQSSLLNQGNVNPDDCGLWLNNLALSASVSPGAGAFIARSGWIASASTYNETAQNSLDGTTGTRWSTMGDRQHAGQWFMVDMLENQTFTGIYLDAGSASYRPVSVRVSVSTDGENWTQVASGNNFSRAVFDPQVARYIRVEQTGSGTTSWRIAEFYVMNTELTALPEIGNNRENPAIWFSQEQLNLKGVDGKSVVNIYDPTGKQVVPSFVMDDSVYLNLPPGIYIVVVRNNDAVFKKKVIKI